MRHSTRCVSMADEMSDRQIGQPDRAVELFRFGFNIAACCESSWRGDKGKFLTCTEQLAQAHWLTSLSGLSDRDTISLTRCLADLRASRSPRKRLWLVRAR